MKVLVTGATGYLGSYLVKRFLQEGVEVNVLCRSEHSLGRLAGLKGTFQLFTREQLRNCPGAVFSGATAVLHCATCYGRKESVAEVFDCNLGLFSEILWGAIEQGVSTFINLDSYFSKPSVLYSALPAYTLSKKHASQWLELGCRGKDLVAINVLLEHLYGPNDNEDKFVNHLLRKLLEGEREIKLTSCEQRRDLIYVEDAVDALYHLVRDSHRLAKGYYRAGLGTGESIRLRDFVEQMHALCSSKATLDFGALPQRPDEIMDSSADLSLFQKLGWAPRVDISEGLRRLKAETNLLSS